jgi:hypothetical protein
MARIVFIRSGVFTTQPDPVYQRLLHRFEECRLLPPPLDDGLRKRLALQVKGDAFRDSCTSARKGRGFVQDT